MAGDQALVLGHEVLVVVVDPTISCGRCPACARGDEHVCPSLRLVGVDQPGGLAARLCVAEAKPHPVPAGLPLTAAALAEPLAVAVHATGRAADIGQALQLLATGSVDVTPPVSEIVGLKDVPAALGRLERGESVKVLTAMRHEGARL